MKRCFKLFSAAFVLASIMAMTSCGDKNSDNPDNKLVLTADKATFTADGEDIVTFTVKQNGVDVTADCNICCEALCLAGNKYSTTEPGVYTFYAYFTDEANDPNHETSNTLEVTAKAVPSDFDTTKNLHKNVNYFVFTGSWCNPCYLFKVDLNDVIVNFTDDNLTVINFYTPLNTPGVSPSEPELAYAGFVNTNNQLKADGRFAIDGYPSVFAELDFELGSGGGRVSKDEVLNVFDEYSVKAAKTGIKVDSEVNGGKAEFTVTVGAKEAGTYYIGVLLVEDNIVCYQNGGGNNYNHTGVVRAMATESLFGDELATLEAGKTASKDFSFDLAPTYNNENLYVLVYTLYEKNGKNVVDNSVKATVNGFTDYKYTN